MATFKKSYEFIRGNDWVYDRLMFDGLEYDVESLTVSMTLGEYKALEAIKKLCHECLGDDYDGPMPMIEIKE